MKSSMELEFRFTQVILLKGFSTLCTVNETSELSFEPWYWGSFIYTLTVMPFSLLRRIELNSYVSEQKEQMVLLQLGLLKKSFWKILLHCSCREAGMGI